MPTASTNTKAEPRLNQARTTRTVKSPTDSPEEAFYETEPLRKTLSELVDLDALSDKRISPRLVISATNVELGEVEYFDSGEQGLSLDQIMASGSLPPAFPATVIGKQS
jgi:NTE family protein